jgi:hypothetical protein
MSQSDEHQFDMFNLGPDWEDEWTDMPEYVTNKIEPHKMIIMRFRNQEDVDEFKKLIDQNITRETKSLWFPKLVFNESIKYRYLDDEKEIKKNESE